jgi:hypothetical protein
MPNWNDVLAEIQVSGSTFDVIRRKYLAQLSAITKRNVIIYYSGWLQKPDVRGVEINDSDKVGLMTTINGLDRKLGLDLVLHTPGGDLAATESIVDYLRQMFGPDIRAVVPQLAMSGGTMMACACKSILMGKQSSLGPTDPQHNGLAAHGVIEEFRTAHEQVKADPTKIPLWQPIIANYSPTLIGECQKAIEWARIIVFDWLASGMFASNFDRDKITRIVNELSEHPLTLSHARHLSIDKCIEIGLVVEKMEDSRPLQDAVLSVHHACMHTLAGTNAYKLIENQNGVAYIQQVRVTLTR